MFLSYVIFHNQKRKTKNEKRKKKNLSSLMQIIFFFSGFVFASLNSFFLCISRLRYNTEYNNNIKSFPGGGEAKLPPDPDLE